MAGAGSWSVLAGSPGATLADRQASSPPSGTSGQSQPLFNIGWFLSFFHRDFDSGEADLTGHWGKRDFV
ncbi:hypothetical protein PENSUB_3728 [Penicillium subrubescens]|uniref:Uncharacterized protein n=1 Tax=Penicillium subrubescens TaxID=1316194 RepID=A0A1Q5UEK6_9EURO|nr:hypothetical protein PENSUB_3728 [Penicillium subrubescens]